jgi:hypothetical protein
MFAITGRKSSEKDENVMMRFFGDLFSLCFVLAFRFDVSRSCGRSKVRNKCLRLDEAVTRPLYFYRLCLFPVPPIEKVGLACKNRYSLGQAKAECIREFIW